MPGTFVLKTLNLKEIVKNLYSSFCKKSIPAYNSCSFNLHDQIRKFQVISVDDNLLTYKAFSADGTLVDNFSMKKKAMVQRNLFIDFIKDYKLILYRK